MVAAWESPAPVTELRFRLSDPSYPVVGASLRQECRFDFQEIVPRRGGRFAEFLSVTGTGPEPVLDRFDDADGADAELLRATDRGHLFEVTVGAESPVVTLARHGGLPRLAQWENGVGDLVAEVPPTHEPSALVAGVLDEHPSAEFVAKRQRRELRSLYAPPGVDAAVRERLTERQREVVRTAYESGYYEWPRERSGEEIAADLGITSATFSQHLAAAERKLLGVLFDDPPAADP